MCVCVGGRYLAQNVLGSETVGGGLFMLGGGSDVLCKCYMGTHISHDI